MSSILILSLSGCASYKAQLIERDLELYHSLRDQAQYYWMQDKEPEAMTYEHKADSVFHE